MHTRIQMKAQVAALFRIDAIQYAHDTTTGVGLDVLAAHFTEQHIFVAGFYPNFAYRVGTGITL